MQKGDHCPLWQYSSLPSSEDLPPDRRIAPSVVHPKVAIVGGGAALQGSLLGRPLHDTPAAPELLNCVFPTKSKSEDLGHCVSLSSAPLHSIYL